MARTKAPGRLEEIAEAAIVVFSRYGYKNAQMADIAREAHVSPGTLYLYVEGKEACFWLAIRRAIGEEVLGADDGPAIAKTLDESLEAVRERIDVMRTSPKLLQALAQPKPATHIDDELRGVLDERYDAMVAGRRLVVLVEQAAKTWPELNTVFFLEMRRTLVATLADYLALRASGGYLRLLDDPATAARLIIEAIAWFGMHRYGDPDSAYISDEAARSTTLDMLFHALKNPS